jgi:putative membrane protein
MKRVVAGIIAFVWADPAFAHISEIPHAEPGWTFAPWLVLTFVLSAGLYGTGAIRLARRAVGGRPMLARRTWLFAAGWLMAAVAAMSPLHEAGEQSFTLHMVEHELLMLVAAPLLVLSRPLGEMLWAFPAAVRRWLGGWAHRDWFRRAWSVLSNPVIATLAQAAALWLWHVPSLFDLALSSEGWHIAQHLSFVITALVFWWAVLDGRRQRGGPPQAIICLFVTSLVAGALGALMALSQSPWYERYAALGLAPFGLTPAEDQQLAGLLMWIPGGLVHAGAALVLISQALNPDQGRQERAGTFPTT